MHLSATTPACIRATDLGEIWTNRGEYEDDVLLCCVDPEGSAGEAVQPETSAMALMEEMARRYNVHAELLAALLAMLDVTEADRELGTHAHSMAVQAARAAIAKAQP